MTRHVRSAAGPGSVPLAATILLTACAAMPDRSTSPPLEGARCRLTDLPGQALPEGQAPTLRFEGLRASGSDGCNRYTGPYTRTGADLRLGPGLASTRMACPGDLQHRADVDLRALVDARRFRIQGTVTANRLDLLAAVGGVIASFTAQADAERH